MSVTWFKVLTDMFADDKIKIIQSMPEGDALLVMWFKVLAQAGKTNDGGYIYLKKKIPYTPAMLAILFGKHQHIVELALRTFTEFGMIDIDDRGYIFVSNWEKHQNIEGMERVREKTRLRTAAYREKKRLELQVGDVTRDATVTHGDALEVELDKEKDTTLLRDDFDRVKDAYEILHKVSEMPYSDALILTKLLDDGIKPELIIGVMKEKYKPSVKTLRFYEGAIRDVVERASSGRSRIARTGQAARMENLPSREDVMAMEEQTKRERQEALRREMFGDDAI